MGKQKTKLVRTNPHGVNQHTEPDPRQSLFLALYLNPKSETFSNAMQSAIKAGYEETYAQVLVSRMPPWLSEKIKSASMLQKAERNLDAVLDLETRVQAMGAFGPIYLKVGLGKNAKKVAVMKTDAQLLKIKTDTSEFVAERVGRATYGKDSDPTPLTQNFFFLNDSQRKRIARRVLLSPEPGEGASS